MLQARTPGDHCFTMKARCDKPVASPSPTYGLSTLIFTATHVILLTLFTSIGQPAGVLTAQSSATSFQTQSALDNFYPLTVLHTNDVHARIEQINKYSALCKPEDKAKQQCFGGIARIKSKVDELRARESNVLFLDAGDQYQGTLWFYTFEGNITAYFMNELKYDAMCLGNHEFDKGIQGLVPFLQNVTFPVLAANMNITGIPELASVKKRMKLKLGGEWIGIVGYITAETPMLSNPEPVTFMDEVESVQREVNELLKENVTKIIALGHAGYWVDKKVAKEVKGLDIVVGGHTNTFLYTGDPPSSEKPDGEYPTIIKQDDGEICLVVQAYAYGKYLGFLQVTFDPDGRLRSWNGNPILLDKTVIPDPAILAKMEPFQLQLTKVVNKVIGETSVLLNGDSQCRLEECNLGNLIADAMVGWYARKAEPDSWNRYAISIVNAGSIRTSIEPGNITFAQLMEVLPFKNDIDIVEVSGSVLLTILEHSVNDYNPQKKHGKFLQYSGIKVTYDLSKPNGERVVEVLVRCSKCLMPKYEPLEKDKAYSLSTSDFLIEGGDGYTMIKKKMKRHIMTGNQDIQVLLEYLKHYSPIVTGVEGRIEFRKNEQLNSGNEEEEQVPSSRGSAAPLYLAMIAFITAFLQCN